MGQKCHIDPVSEKDYFNFISHTASNPGASAVHWLNAAG